MLRTAFGKILKSLRTEKGLSQEELGFRANLHRTFISQLERGLKSPTLDTLFDLCGVLEVLPSDLLRRIETEVSKQKR